MDQGAARALDRDTHGEAVTATVTKPATKTDRRENPIFIRRELDEYGLTPNELRVYARISRRAGETGVCYESIPNMAEGIGLSACTVRRCCQVLALARLITESNREGHTTDRRITPMSVWQNKAELPGIRKIVLRGEKARTPITSDSGMPKDTPRTKNRGGLSPATGAPLSQQTGLPLSPATDEGNPSEGSPSEVNPNKEIPHTQSATDLEEAITPEIVCVSSSTIFSELDQEENPWNTEPWSYQQVRQHVEYRRRQGDDVRSVTGLTKSILRERHPDIYFEIQDSLILIQAEREYDEQRRARQRELEEYHRQVAAQAAAEAEALHRQQAEEEARRAEEWERNAPQREAARLEQQRRETMNRVEEAKRLTRQSATSPDLYAGMIRNVLAGDEEATRLFKEWLASESNTRASDAAA